MPWTRSIHLDQWANELASRGQLPHVVRRLIRRTIPSLQVLDFPAFEQIGRTGFDGTVECDQGNQYVPAGASRWELGTGKDPEKKANEDFKSRTDELSQEEQSKVAFVFVTPRPWKKEDRDKWIEKKAAISKWREIHVHDGNDLEHWMETAPDIDIWFSRLIGHAPAGVQDLSSYWNALRRIADPSLSAAVFTASREDEIERISKWLSEPPTSLFMRTNGLFEGLDFIAAMSSDKNYEILQTGVIVHTPEMWRSLASMREAMILLPAPALELQAADVSEAINAGHHVFVSGPRGNMAASSDQVLRRQECDSVRKALIESGYSEAPAAKFALACCGSSSILKRLIARRHETAFPRWSQDDVRLDLAPFAMIGGWRASTR